MKWIGNGPELMADLVVKLAARGTSLANKHRQAHFYVSYEYEKAIVLSEVSDYYGIDA
jgi:hypothetical protein